MDTLYSIGSLGITNNNPGNIRYTGSYWVGLTGSNSGFCVFSSMTFGVRAAIKNMQTYYKRGYTTLTKYISVYAPASENDTANYISYVSKNTGIDKDSVFAFSAENVKKILYYMFIMESKYYLDESTFSDAWYLVTGERIAIDGIMLVAIGLLFYAGYKMYKRTKNKKQNDNKIHR